MQPESSVSPKVFTTKHSDVGMDVHKLTYHEALRRADGAIETWGTEAGPERFCAQLNQLDIRISGIVADP